MVWCVAGAGRGCLGGWLAGSGLGACREPPLSPRGDTWLVFYLEVHHPAVIFALIVTRGDNTHQITLLVPFLLSSICRVS